MANAVSGTIAGCMLPIVVVAVVYFLTRDSTAARPPGRSRAARWQLAAAILCAFCLGAVAGVIGGVGLIR